jgi:hypothetical protein
MSAPPEVTANSITRKVFEFLHIELAPLANGKISVSVTATTVDDEEPQLLNQEIATDQVATVDDALALIATHVQATMQ